MIKERKLPTRLFKIISITLIVIITFIYFYIVFPFWGIPFNAQRHTAPPLTPAWALECWLWEDDVNNARRVDELLEGYAKNDIPVRTILLDSPWSTRYNDFIVDEKRYPDPEQWFKKLEDNGYRVVLWMTPMVNSKNKDTDIKDAARWFEIANKNGFLVADGDQINWWKGRGGFIDYTNPNAVSWWRNMQQKVFDYGIDGWKLDGAATLFWGNLGPIPIFYKKAYDGWMTTRSYMDHYYRDEYAYGLKQNPEFVTLVRAIDRPYIHPEGFAPLDAAPVTWVGDQKHTWKSGGESSENSGETGDLVMDGIEGIEMAIENILVSAELGYNIIGSDVAGFSGRTIPPRLYIRWAQFSAFCGLFLNGGHGERALWKRSGQELEIIRKFSWLHTELIPYMYSHTVLCHEGGKPLQRPIDGKYHYLFGDDFLIAPIFQDSPRPTIMLPEGRWYYFFDNNESIQGPKTFTRYFPLDEYPVYIREGAIIPLNITRSYTGIGDSTSSGYITLLLFPTIEENQFVLHHSMGGGNTTIRLQKHENVIKILLKGRKISHILRIHLLQKPLKIILDDLQLTESDGWIYDIKNKYLVIKTIDYSKGNYTIHMN